MATKQNTRKRPGTLGVDFVTVDLQQLSFAKNIISTNVRSTCTGKKKPEQYYLGVEVKVPDEVTRNIDTHAVVSSHTFGLPTAALVDWVRKVPQKFTVKIQTNSCLSKNPKEAVIRKSLASAAAQIKSGKGKYFKQVEDAAREHVKWMLFSYNGKLKTVLTSPAARVTDTVCSKGMQNIDAVLEVLKLMHVQMKESMTEAAAIDASNGSVVTIEDAIAGSVGTLRTYLERELPSHQARATANRSHTTQLDRTTCEYTARKAIEAISASFGVGANYRN